MAILFAGLAGLWLVLQATGGRLGGALLSRRAVRPGEVPPPDAAAPSAGTTEVPSTTAATGFIWPVHARVSQEWHDHGNTHPGIDIACPCGTPVGAAASGTVTSTQTPQQSGGYGNLVVLDHGGGISTAYAHLASIAVTAGRQVIQGTVVGVSNNTGNSTGCHLHFEVRKDGGTVNPRDFVKGNP